MNRTMFRGGRIELSKEDINRIYGRAMREHISMPVGFKLEKTNITNWKNEFENT